MERLCAGAGLTGPAWGFSLNGKVVHINFTGVI